MNNHLKALTEANSGGYSRTRIFVGAAQGPAVSAAGFIRRQLIDPMAHFRAIQRHAGTRLRLVQPTWARWPPVEPCTHDSVFKTRIKAEMLPYDIDDATDALCTSDPVLCRLIARVGLFKLTLSTDWTLFQHLAHSVVFQQISKNAGTAIQSRLWNLFGNVLTPAKVAESSVESLRAVGLSRSKADTLQGLACSFLSGRLPERDALDNMTDDAIISALTAHRGIGPWTAQMVLIFHLGRPDVLPVTDLGIRRGFKIAFERDLLPTVGELARYGTRWQPWRSVASWYLWRANDL